MSITRGEVKVTIAKFIEAAYSEDLMLRTGYYESMGYNFFSPLQTAFYLRCA